MHPAELYGEHRVQVLRGIRATALGLPAFLKHKKPPASRVVPIPLRAMC